MLVPVAPGLDALLIYESVLLRIEINGSPDKINFEVRMHHARPNFFLTNFFPTGPPLHDAVYNIIPVALDNAVRS